MKIVLRIVLLIVVALIAFGFYTNKVAHAEGEKFIGVGVLILAFILMPLFIYHRYNGRDLSRYSIRNTFKKEDEKD